MIDKLDAKDFEILRELDSNYRQSFSKIAKKVSLSKNSVALRFKKLQKYLVHGVVGINHEILGFTQVRVHFSFNYLDSKLDEELVEEFSKQKSLAWAARLFGRYNYVACFFIKDIHEITHQLINISARFSGRMDMMDIHIVHEQYHFRFDMVHKEPLHKIYKIISNEKPINLNSIEKKIMGAFRPYPRMAVFDIARITGLATKTISTNIKSMEKRGIIMGYFLTLDPTKFGMDTFKLLLNVQNSGELKKFDNYLTQIKNIRYIGKMIGKWNYELDFVYPSINALQSEIDLIKVKFPNKIISFEILSVGKRTLTNIEGILAR